MVIGDGGIVGSRHRRHPPAVYGKAQDHISQCEDGACNEGASVGEPAFKDTHRQVPDRDSRGNPFGIGMGRVTAGQGRGRRCARMDSARSPASPSTARRPPGRAGRRGADPSDLPSAAR